MEEWDMYMKDFVPEDFITMKMEPKTEEVIIVAHMLDFL